MKRLAIAAILPAALAAAAGAPLQVDFSRGKWNPSEWTRVKSGRWNYTGEFMQMDDHILNKCPDLSDEEIYSRHINEVYAAIVHTNKFRFGCTLLSTMSFDHKMAPIIVLAPELGKDANGSPEFLEHWEVVLFDEGINVWHHFRDAANRPVFELAAFCRTPFKPKVKYTLSVAMRKGVAGHREMAVTCGDAVFGYLDDNLPGEFFAGVIGCEGRNRFYDFSAVPEN